MKNERRDCVIGLGLWLGLVLLVNFILIRFRVDEQVLLMFCSDGPRLFVRKYLLFCSLRMRTFTNSKQTRLAALYNIYTRTNISGYGSGRYVNSFYFQVIFPASFVIGSY